MKRSVFCILKNRGDAELAVERLQTAGFSSHDVSVLFPEEMSHLEEREATKAPEGATTGGTTGFVVGGVLGWLAGIGSLAIPGLGPFIAAGPILGALSGAAVGAAVGGLTGALIGMGIPEHEARHYESRLKEGNVFLSVHTHHEEDAMRAKGILEGLKAEDIATSGEMPVAHPVATHASPQMPPPSDEPLAPPYTGEKGTGTLPPQPPRGIGGGQGPSGVDPIV